MFINNGPDNIDSNKLFCQIHVRVNLTSLSGYSADL